MNFEFPSYRHPHPLPWKSLCCRFHPSSSVFQSHLLPFWAWCMVCSLYTLVSLFQFSAKGLTSIQHLFGKIFRGSVGHISSHQYAYSITLMSSLHSAQLLLFFAFCLLNIYCLLVSSFHLSFSLSFLDYYPFSTLRCPWITFKWKAELGYKAKYH